MTRDREGGRGSYGRFGWVLVPVWLLAVWMLLDLAARIGGPARVVAWTAGAATVVAAVGFLSIWLAGRRGS